MLTVRAEDAKKKDWANTPLPKLVEGNALDTFYTMRIFRKLEPMLKDIGVFPVSEKLYVPLVRIFSKIERVGMEVAMNELKYVGNNLKNTIMDIEDSLYAEKGINSGKNLGSTADLKEILYTEEGFGLYAPKFTDTDQPSTDAETLKELLSQIEEELESRG